MLMSEIKQNISKVDFFEPAKNGDLQILSERI
jgi:hypothetical protein